MERILVIGATGRIGRELTRLWTTRGQPVRALVRAPARAALAPQIELVVGDLRDPESLRRACVGVDRLVLVTPDGPEQAALEGAAITAAARAGLRQIVKLSGCVAGAPGSGRFGEQHARAEAALHRAGVDWTVLRPNVFMQNFLEFAPMIARKRLFLAPLADARVSLVDARDVAAAACAVLGRPEHFGRTYSVTGPESLRFADAAAILSRELGTEIRYRSVPGLVAGLAMLAGRTPWWQMRGTLEVFAFVRAGGEAATSDAVLRLTGQPPRGFAEFVRDHRAHFCAA